MNRLLLLLCVICVLGMEACHAQRTTQPEKTAQDSVQISLLTKADFLKQVFNYEKDSVWKFLGDKPAIVDFYADWCQPCKVVAPILAELAQTHKDRIVVYKVDVDQERELAAVFGIESSPSVLFIPKEGRPSMVRGALPKAVFEQAVNEILLKKQ